MNVIRLRDYDVPEVWPRLRVDAHAVVAEHVAAVEVDEASLVSAFSVKVTLLYGGSVIAAHAQYHSQYGWTPDRGPWQDQYNQARLQAEHYAEWLCDRVEALTQSGV